MGCRVLKEVGFKGCFKVGLGGFKIVLFFFVGFRSFWGV